MFELTVEENVFIILTLNIFQLRQVEEKDNNCPKSFSWTWKQNLLSHFQPSRRIIISNILLWLWNEVMLGWETSGQEIKWCIGVLMNLP